MTEPPTTKEPFLKPKIRITLSFEHFHLTRPLSVLVEM